MSSSILIGAVLTFALADATEMNLSVALSRPAPARLTWNGQDYESGKRQRRHVFSNLPTPRQGAIEYRLYVGKEAPRIEHVQSPFGPNVRIALYGDSRDGSGPHETIVRQIAEHEPHVLIHTGDVVHRAGDDEGWIAHLAATLPISSRAPVVLALGNHEVAPPADGRKMDPLKSAFERIPPPYDPVARKFGTRPSIYHVRFGSRLIVVLDSNVPYHRVSLQYRYLLKVLAEHPDARWRMVAMHHGPRSTGRHGPHPDAEDLVEVLGREGVTASLAGHDHVYERLVEGPVTYVVSGGGGAPLYGRSWFSNASRAFAATYNWVRLDLGQDAGSLTAYSLEGVLLDRATLPAEPSEQPRRFGWSGWAVLAVTLLFVGLAVAAVQLASSGRNLMAGIVGWMVLSAIGSAGCVRVAATAAQPTALERQLLGAYEELDRELIYASSIRGPQQSSPLDNAIKAEAIRARAVQRFNQDDLLELLSSGCVAEAADGGVVVRPCPAVQEDNELERRRRRVVEEENAARRAIVQWAAHELARRDGRTHPTKEELTAVQNAYARLVQDTLPSGALREVSPGQFEAK